MLWRLGSAMGRHRRKRMGRWWSTGTKVAVLVRVLLGPDTANVGLNSGGAAAVSV